MNMSTSTAKARADREPAIELSRYKRLPINFDDGSIEIVTKRTATFPHNEEIILQLQGGGAEVATVTLEVRAEFKKDGIVIAKERSFPIDYKGLEKLVGRITHFLDFGRARSRAQLGDEVSVELFDGIVMALRADSAEERFFYIDVAHGKEQARARLMSKDQQLIGALKTSLRNTLIDLR